jgi:superfamily I DNA/RNA helicase
VVNEFTCDESERRYKHIIIDEGQDFSPMMIKSLVEAIPEDGSFTFFGDVAQQIYGNRMSWKETGLTISGTWRFAINYRNPETIVAFAKELANSRYWKHSDDMVDCEEANAVGPKPVLIKFKDEEQERQWIVNRAIQESKKSSAVIVCRNRNDIDVYLAELKDMGCVAIEIDRKTAGFGDRKQVYLSTYHAVKGLEFYNVFIPALSDKKMPDYEALERNEDSLEVYADELKLLYVAVTRSKYGLYMSYSGKLTELFPSPTNTVDIKEV